MSTDDKQLAQAVSDLLDEYRKAQTMSYVRDPLSYALYAVWKKYDNSWKRRRKNDEDLDKA